MKELIKKQNRYLHQVHAISFINIRSLEGTFSINYKDELGNKRKTIDDRAEEGGIITDEYATANEEENVTMDNREEEDDSNTFTDGTKDTEMREESNQSSKNPQEHNQSEENNPANDEDSQVVEVSFLDKLLYLAGEGESFFFVVGAQPKGAILFSDH